jgi:FKBP-type peptidyl-prolyl cis-trans isomerase
MRDDTTGVDHRFVAEVVVPFHEPRTQLSTEVDVSRRSLLTLLITVFLLAVVVTAGCSPQPAPAPEQPTESEQPAVEEPPAADEGPGTTEDVTELKVEDIVEGTGPEAKPGDNVTVHYTGWLTDGTKFDSSLDAGTPFTFGLGQGQVIRGWDEGVAGMKVGGKRRLTIPASMGYGDQGAGGGAIPPGATLVFDVELLSIN